MRTPDARRSKPCQPQPHMSGSALSLTVQNLHNEHQRAENAIAGLQSLRDTFSRRANEIAASKWDYEASLLFNDVGNKDLAWRILHVRWNVLDSRSREAELLRRLVERHRNFNMVLLGLVRCLSSIGLDQIFQTCDADLHPVLLQVINDYLGSEGHQNPSQLTETNLRPLRTLIERKGVKEPDVSGS